MGQGLASRFSLFFFFLLSFFLFQYTRANTSAWAHRGVEMSMRRRAGAGFGLLFSSTSWHTPFRALASGCGIYDLNFSICVLSWGSGEEEWTKPVHMEREL
ncbi:hypothetical protein B0I37DRAFT_379471, partial [Chaetomium sp. MPI-CAGE-AT-0009]